MSDAPPDHRIAIIGAGFGGLGMAIRLRQTGRTDFVILERAADVGGVWRENTYPGAACDVPSHLYSYSWSRPSWTRRYSKQPEILTYLQRQFETNDLAAHARFGAKVATVRWDPTAEFWRVELADGSVVTAAVVVSAVGQLTQPVLPAIPGVESFAGDSWHSARWNHDVDLADKRIGVVGTGASAIQLVPEVAKVARSVHVFQRSAPYILPKTDYAYDSLRGAPFRLVEPLKRVNRAAIFATGELLTSAYVRSERMAGLVTGKWRKHLEAQVSDPDLREKATPDYRVGCKRIGFSNDWYPTLGQDHVELVISAVEAVTPDGVTLAGGEHRPLDVLIYGTGFGATRFLQPMDVVGREGQSLQEEWSDGAEAYNGVAVAGFPNFFMLYGPNSNLGANSIIYMLESQIDYVLDALGAMERDDLAWIDVRADAEAADNRWLDEASARTTFRSGCHSWYLNASGRNVNNWPTFTFLYRHKLRRLDLLDYDVATV